MDNMAERWSAFGFITVEISGHDFDQIAEAFKTEHVGHPLAIIADTVKGKGVGFAEDKTEWHDNLLTDDLYEKAKAEVSESSEQKQACIRAAERYKNRKLVKS